MKKKTAILISIILSVFVLFAGFSASAATAIKLTPASITIMEGETQALTVKVNNKKVNASNCIFKTGKSSVATVNSKGLVTARKKGAATITVTLKSNRRIKKSCKVTVKPKMVVTPASVNVMAGNTKTLTVKVDGKSVEA